MLILFIVGFVALGTPKPVHADEFNYAIIHSEDVALILGQSGDALITVTFVAGAPQDVVLACKVGYLPVGASCSWAPDNHGTPNPSIAKTLTITTTVSTPIADSVIEINGTSAGTAEKLDAFYLHVLAPMTTTTTVTPTTTITQTNTATSWLTSTTITNTTATSWVTGATTTTMNIYNVTQTKNVIVTQSPEAADYTWLLIGVVVCVIFAAVVLMLIRSRGSGI